MNREPVLFRVDGTPQSGWARLSRCRTLAAALQRRRRPSHFLSRVEPIGLAGPLKRGGIDWIPAFESVGADGDIVQIAREIRKLSPAAIIVDSPEADISYLSELVGTGPLVVSFDHLAQHPAVAHLLINPLLAPAADGFELSPGTQV